MFIIWQAIKDFLRYHKECMELTKSQGKKHFWSDLTDTGLLVTLNSTIELTEYLRSTKIGFTYVMTKRFNQDALEVSVEYRVNLKHGNNGVNAIWDKKKKYRHKH